MSRTYLFIAYFFCCSWVSGQRPEHLADVCSEVAESSGLALIDGIIWTFNDSGGEAALYAIDSASGRLVRKVAVSNAVNTDWEAIAFDHRYVYIGDVGNNAGRRDRLYVYRISRKELSDPSTVSVSADTLSFHYLKQHGKKAMNKKSKYDCEAMVCMRDTLFLISKNWMNQSMAVIYAIPARPGYYKVLPYAYLPADGLVCDAALSSDMTMLAVVGYVDYMPFATVYRISGPGMLKPERLYDTEFARYHGLQAEGITFNGNHELILSSERNKFFTNSLFRIRIKGLFSF